MNKTLKRTMTVAIALSIIGCGLPAFTGGTNIHKSAFAADVGMEAKKVGDGVDLNYNKVKGASLTLDSDIGLNFYIYLTEEVKKAVLSGPKGDISINENDFNVQEEGTVKLSYPINPLQLYDMISLKLYDAKNNQLDIFDSEDIKYFDGIFEYNANNYLCEVLDSPHEYFDSDWSDYKIGICKDLAGTIRSYCDTTKEYFSKPDMERRDYNNDEIINTQNVVPSFSSHEATVSLVLDSKFAVRLYVDDLKSSDTAKYGVKTLIPRKAWDGRYYFEISGITPTKLCDQIVIKYNGNNYTFCPLSWAYRVVTTEYAPNKDVTMANQLYNYYSTAKGFAEAE